MNFNFLNPSFLWALPLSLSPLLLHLLFRRPPKTVVFSDLRLLKIVLQRTQPRKKLKEWLILLCRILTILFLLFFFSRPVFHWGGAIGKEDTSALIILLDASYSMQAQQSGLSQWERALRLAKTTLQNLKENDRACLIVFSDKIDFFSGPLSNRHQDLIRNLDESNVSFRTTNIEQPLQKAYQTLANSGASNKAILILSDMARRGWADNLTASLIKNFDPTVKLLYVNSPEIKDNVSVQNVQLLPDYYSNLLRVQAEVKNWGNDPVPNLSVFLENTESSKGSETVVHLAPKESKTVTLTEPMPIRTASGKVGIRADALTADNDYYFTQPVPQKIKILCVEEHTGIAVLSAESYYLRQALLAPPSQFQIETITLGELKKTPLRGFQVVVLVNPSQIEDQTAQHLRQYINSGGALLLTAGERTAIHPPDLIMEWLPCTLQNTRETINLTIQINPSADENLKNFSSDYELQKLQVSKIITPALKEEGSGWILLSDGTPLLIFSRMNKTAVWTTTLDRSWNNFASKPIFVPLMRLIFKTLSSQIWDMGYGIQDSKTLKPPSEIPGIYKNLAVNLDRSQNESDLEKITLLDLQKIFPDAKWLRLEAGESFQKELLSALQGKELSRWFLFCAAICLFGEFYLTRRKK